MTYVHVTSHIGENEKMEQKEDEFLSGALTAEGELVDMGGEQVVESEMPEVDECGQS